MTSWFRRQRGPEPTVRQQDPDTPVALAADLVGLVRLVNRSAGRLPPAATVAARAITDAVRGVLDCLADDADPDVHAILSVRGIVRDYLPSTLNGYLALGIAPDDVMSPGATAPRDQLLEQLEHLWSAATDVLAATRARDADDLVTQGNFLRTKFTGSDLDL